MSIRFAASRRGDTPRVQRPPAAAVLALLIILLGATACVPAQVPPEKAIVGKWVNAQGGTIYFYEDGTGFVPGLGGGEGQVEEIPDTKFTYYLQDDTHLGVVFEGQEAMIVELKLEGDKMTWGNAYNDIKYVYTRSR